MRLALAFISITGCFAPTPPTGIACAPIGAAERCPSGQQCVMNAGRETCETTAPLVDSGIAADAPVPVDAPGDRDHDGISDSVDNCPDDANATQANEDGDAFGDDCDPCPPFANNQDSDGDGVGDACDPNPQSAGDKLVAFEGFKDALSGSWTVMGTFSTSNGDGVLSAADTATSLLTRATPAGTHVEIRAAFTIDSITATGLNLGAISVIQRMQPGTDSSINCQLAGLGSGASEALRIFDTSETTNVASAAYGFAAGDAKELRFGRDGTSYVCSVTNPATHLTGTAAFNPASPRIGLRVHGAVARWHWVMLVTSP